MHVQSPGNPAYLGQLCQLVREVEVPLLLGAGFDVEIRWVAGWPETGGGALFLQAKLRLCRLASTGERRWLPRCARRAVPTAAHPARLLRTS